MPLSSGTRLGPYEIVTSIGAGGMGEVYRAIDGNLKRSVAIKVLPAAMAADADRLARFQREAEVLAALNHPNIAAIYGLEKTPDFTALVMELVEGQDLSELMHGKAEAPALHLSDALPIARQIADALEAAHELGIVHRDLKPANIKVRADGTVKVLDFGLAKALDPGASDAASFSAANSPTLTNRATQMGMILGTAAYMAPEQARGRPVDRRADIWAFGVVLYEMLAGRRAFEGEDISITLANVLKEDVQWSALPPGLPASLHRLLRRCLEKDPKRRLSSIGDARLDLDEALGGRSDGPSAVLTPASAAAPLWRRALPWAVASVAVIAAAVLGNMALRARPADSIIWTSIPAPVSQFSRGMGPAVSPDGRRIAFVAPDETGRESVWTRSLDAQSAQKVAGTEGALGPFWSPDGTRIGLYNDQKLQTIYSSGGTPQVLADASNPRGATWGADGVIVFVPSAGLGLHRVSASSGGTAVPVDVGLDQSVNLSSYPSFLPDGQRFLFTCVKEGDTWINVGSLTTATSTPVLRAFSRAEYANGHLLFGSKGALYAQPFDPATLELSGERVRVIDSVGLVQGNTQNYSFSATSDVIAAGNLHFVQESQLTWLDAEGKRTGTFGEPGPIFGFSVSPDRTRIVIERIDRRINSVDPWIVQLDSGFTAPVRAMSEGALASSPVWSHDGQKILYSSGYGMLRSVSKAGGAETMWPVGAHWPQSASPDGQFVLISQAHTSTGNDLMLVPLNGDHTPTPFLRTAFSERSARFSPNGKFVAYVSDESTQNEIYVRSFPGDQIKFRVSGAGGTHPEWSEDGSQLYFLSGSGGLANMMVSDISAAGASAPRKLFDLPAGAREMNRSQYAVFDKGRRFLVNIFVPVTAPQVITVGQHWAVGLGKAR